MAWCRRIDGFVGFHRGDGESIFMNLKGFKEGMA